KECMCWSTMTSAFGAAGLELGGEADSLIIVEQADRLAPNTTTLNLAAPRTIRRRAASSVKPRRPSGFVISRPPLEGREHYRFCSFPGGLISLATRRTHGQASQLIMVRSGPANTGRTAAERHRSSTSGDKLSVVARGSSSRYTTVMYCG